MYYQNGNYMQDLNYYNQNPNFGYNPYMQNNYPSRNTQMPMQQNLNAMYPAVYRIISPVVSQVLMNNNVGYLTEDVINNMVDSIYNIVEGDINLEDNSNFESNSVSTEDSNNTNCTRTNSTNPSSRTAVTRTNGANRQNSLLRDLIKIMLLNDIIARRQNNNPSMMMLNSMPNGNMNGAMFG